MIQPCLPPRMRAVVRAQAALLSLLLGGLALLAPTSAVSANSAATSLVSAPGAKSGALTAPGAKSGALTAPRPHFKPITKTVEVVRLSPASGAEQAVELADAASGQRLPQRKPLFIRAVETVELSRAQRRQLAGGTVALPPAELVITAVGDTGFARGGTPGQAQRYPFSGQSLPYADAFSQVRSLIDGDLNFFNLETVLSSRRLPKTDKRFVFVTHPDALTAIRAAGFNLASLANNHSYDAGWEGMRDTLMQTQQSSGLTAAGLGRLDEVAQPRIIDWQGSRIAFNALSFLSHPFRASDSQVGQLNLRNPRDIDAVIAGFRAADADYRILSMHIGQELAQVPEAGNRALMQRLAEEGGVDLIIAHHPHVMRPVERLPNGTLIFHSLGNFALLGAANINGRGTAVDWGGLARIYLARQADGRFSARALEMLPLKDVHGRPRPLSRADSSARIKGLNQLTARALPKTGVRWRLGELGQGVVCLQEATATGSDLAAEAALALSASRAAALCPDQLARGTDRE